MVELSEQDIRTNNRQSSKGNQLKWYKNEIWYKADYTGYEGLAEYLLWICQIFGLQQYKFSFGGMASHNTGASVSEFLPGKLEQKYLFDQGYGG